MSLISAFRNRGGPGSQAFNLSVNGLKLGVNRERWLQYAANSMREWMKKLFLWKRPPQNIINIQVHYTSFLFEHWTACVQPRLPGIYPWLMRLATTNLQTKLNTNALTTLLAAWACTSMIKMPVIGLKRPINHPSLIDHCFCHISLPPGTVCSCI